MKINKTLVKTTFDILTREGSEEALGIMRNIDAFYRYFSCVEVYNEKIQAFRSIYETDEYQYEYRKLDENRTELHNEAIAALKNIYAICKRKGFIVVDKDIAKTHRTEIAEAIFEFIKND